MLKKTTLILMAILLAATVAFAGNYRSTSTGVILSDSDIARQFPLTSFAASGPNDEFLTANGLERYTPPVPGPTPDQIAATTMSQLEAFYDSRAQEKGFDTRYTLIARAGYTGPWQATAQAFGAWMDGCNIYAASVKAAVLSGNRPIPTADQLIAELPALVWP